MPAALGVKTTTVQPTMREIFGLHERGFLVKKHHSWRGEYNRILVVRKRTLSTWTPDGKVTTNVWLSEALRGCQFHVVRGTDASSSFVLNITLFLRSKSWYGLHQNDELHLSVGAVGRECRQLVGALNRILLQSLTAATVGVPRPFSAATACTRLDRVTILSTVEEAHAGEEAGEEAEAVEVSLEAVEVALEATAEMAAQASEAVTVGYGVEREAEACEGAAPTQVEAEASSTEIEACSQVVEANAVPEAEEGSLVREQLDSSNGPHVMGTPVKAWPRHTSRDSLEASPRRTSHGLSTSGAEPWSRSKMDRFADHHSIYGRGAPASQGRGNGTPRKTPGRDHRQTPRKTSTPRLLADGGTSTPQPSADGGTSTPQPLADRGTSTPQPLADRGTSTPQPLADGGTSTPRLLADGGTSTPQPSADRGTSTPQPSADAGWDASSPPPPPTPMVMEAVSAVRAESSGMLTVRQVHESLLERNGFETVPISKVRHQ